MIRIVNVSKRYGHHVALRNVSLELRAGETTLLLGPNGAGKSTLLRCLLGMTEYEGTIAVAGLDPLRHGCAVRSLVGYMPQSGGLHAELTVEETVRLYADIRRAPIERALALLDEAGLAGHRLGKVGDLSGGMRQRLGFTIALLTDPPILVLDEPSASLDEGSRAWLASRLHHVASRGRVVLVSTHAGQELWGERTRRITLEDGVVVRDESAGGAATPPPPEPAPRPASSITPLVRKELRDAVHNRWLLTYAVVLGLLGVASAASGIGSSSGLGLQAFGRTTATLMNLCLLLAPLVAVLMGASAIAGERERGTLEHLLAQPLGRTALLLAKHVGLLAALTAATLVGFVPAGVLIAAAGADASIGHYLVFPALASLVGTAMLGVGLLISVSSRTATQAQGAAVFAWFGFVLLYDLVLVGSLTLGGVPIEVLAAALVVNPVDAARVLGVLTLEPDLYLLGPAGAYLTTRFSLAGTAALLLAASAGWAVAPLYLATIRFALPRPRASRVGRRTVADTTTEVTFS